MITAVILAAGESRRMGSENKLLLHFGRETLIRKFVKSVCESKVENVLVVVGKDARKVKKNILDQPVSFVYNPFYKEGITSSIKTGVKAASMESDGFMICLSDLPFADKEDFNLLINTFTSLRAKEKGALVVVPVFKGNRGNPALFSSEFREIILNHKEEGCRAIIEKNRKNTREVLMRNDNLFRDIDTPEDYEYNILQIKS